MDSPDKKAWECFLEEIADNPKLSDIAAEVRQKITDWSFLEQAGPRAAKEIANGTAREMLTLALRTRQRLESPAWNSKTKGLTPDEFEKLPRNAFKAWQEVLSDSADRQPVDRFEDIIINPTRVSQTLFEAADLGGYYPDGPSVKKIERLEAHAVALPELVKFLSQLTPLKGRDGLGGEEELFRFYRIPEGYSMNGKLVGLQEAAGQKRAFVTDIVSARRRFNHIRQGYGREREQLMYIRAELLRFDGLLGEGAMVPKKELTEGKKKLMDIVNALEHVTNEEKKGLRDLIQKILTLRDSRQRVNPGVARNAINFKTGPLSEARLREMVRIARHLEGDEQFIHTLVASQVVPFGFFRQKVEETGDARLHIMNPQKPLTENQIERLKRVSDYFNSIQFEPFKSMAVRIQGYIHQALQGVEKNTQKSRFAAKHAFLRAYLVAKIEKIYWELQDIHTRLDAGLHHEIFLKGELEKIQNLRKSMRSRALAPDAKLFDFKPFFDELDALLTKLIQDVSLAIKIYKQSKGDYTQNRGIKARLLSAKGAMKAFDFIAWIQRLPTPDSNLRVQE